MEGGEYKSYLPDSSSNGMYSNQSYNYFISCLLVWKTFRVNRGHNLFLQNWLETLTAKQQVNDMYQFVELWKFDILIVYYFSLFLV